MCLGLANDYAPKEEKKTVSLIKRKTNFDKIQEMDVYELSRVLMCPCEMDIETNWACKGGSCIDCVKKWLESEAKE